MLNIYYGNGTIKSNLFQIKRSVLAEIEALAWQGFPYEICGFIGGSEPGRGERVRPARNVARQPQVEYNIAPEETLSVLLELESQGQQIRGVYHSHPNYPARPSGTDLDMADWPNAAYLITSVYEGPGGSQQVETRAWRLTGRQAFPLELVIFD